MKEELGKLFRGKLIFGLILLSVTVNFYLLFMQRDKISVLRVIDDFSRENGSVVSEGKMGMLAGIWKEEITDDISWEEFENNMENAAGYYEAVQSSDMAGIYCSLKHIEGRAAEYVHKEFRKLEGPIKEAAGQEMTLFAPYRMYIFEFIATYLLFAINLEGIMAAVIVTLYSLDMERSSRTASTVYSTRKGKRIVRDKLFTSVIGSLGCLLAITAVTFFMAGCIFPINTVMNTMISNPMVSLKGAPCIAKETITIGEYIFRSLGMSGILAVIYSLGSFAIGLKTQNGYYAFSILMVLLGIMKVFSAIAPTSTYMFFWTQYNPLDMALKAGTWFLYNSNNFSPSGYESFTAVLWIAVCAAGCICGIHSMERRRKKQ